MADLADLAPGQRVRIERDETRWPARGTWARYRGRAATVIILNRRDREVGVAFGRTHRDAEGHLRGRAITWFRPHELREQ